MVRRSATLVLCGAACSFDIRPGNGAGDAALDTANDSAIDSANDSANDSAIDAPRCQGWMPEHVDACAIGTPQPTVTLTSALEPYTYNTTVGGGVLTDRNQAVIVTSDVAAAQTGGPLVAVLNVESFALEAGARLFVIGNKPLVIAAWSTISIAGTLDAGSTTGELDAVTRIDGATRIGAGANPPGLCATAVGSNGTNAVSSGGSGGGGGGALSGNGGNGGIGDTSMQPGGPGGVALGIPSVIRGGCAGGRSGTAGSGISSPATSSTISSGGNGGGAIELAAQTAITITGTITAGGAGGAGAPQGSACGGGGGGAGGYIGLDAPTVTAINGTIAANGGGGGGSAPFAGQGNQGGNAVSAARAPGGAVSGGTCGLAGGAGAAGANRNGLANTANDSCGGGGGGGAAGYILVWAPALTTTGAQISPTQQPGP